MFQIFFAHKLDEFIEEKGLSKTKFGEKIFNTKSGGRIWRTTKDLDRRRHISVADCFYIAKALEKDLPSIVWQICQAASQVNLVEYVDKLWEEREE